MPDRIRLDGKVAVVTGAAGVIGTATIRLLAKRGARVVAVDRRELDLQSAIKDLPAAAQALAVTADVTDENEVAQYVRAAVDKFTASIAGLIGSPEVAVYSASKHAVIGLTRSAALECSTTNVRVNCVCPGLIDSRMLSAIIQGRNPGNAPTPNDKIVERIPARRLGQASEVASIVAFLASDEASYVSGSAYTVDGGRTAS